MQSNYGNWQYVAGVGTDPRDHRKFNMIKQAKDYDPTGEYVRLWIPELRVLPCGDHGLFMPWEAADGLPQGYPPPMIIEPEWTRFNHRTGSKARQSDWKVKRFGHR